MGGKLKSTATLALAESLATGIACGLRKRKHRFGLDR